MQTFHWKGYDLPIDLLEMTGGGTDTFDEISRNHRASTDMRIGLRPDFNIVEIGCGIGRDAIPLSEFLTTGSYIGIDIIGRSIDWCTQNISSRHPNFQFHHFNIDDYLHNPDGVLKTVDMTLPVETKSVDRVIMFSVFTHLFQADIEHYLRECSRILREDGLIYTSMFVYDEAVLAKAHETNIIRFDHEYSDGCRINSLENPLGAVAYSNAKIYEMVENGGMELSAPIHRGGWSGVIPNLLEGQDIIILKNRS
jgi:SAM-dependent methyltransferase